MAEEAKLIKETAEAVEGIVKAVPVYQDAIQPGAKEVGRALGTVGKAVNVALAPVAGLVWGYEKIQEFLSARLSQKLKDVPPEQIQTPPANVAGPAMEALRFAGDQAELREMYATLLATSMEAKRAPAAHPAFVEVIKQLTPDEAKIMRRLADGVPRPVVNVYEATPGEDGERLAYRYACMLDEEAQIARPEMLGGYLDNLARLGLVEIPSDLLLTFEGVYDPLEQHPNALALLKRIRDRGDKPRFERLLLRLTSLGRHFIHACVVEPTALRNASVSADLAAEPPEGG